MIHLDRVRRAVVQTVVQATGAVCLWAPSQYPRRSLGAAVVTARVTRGPRVLATDVFTVTDDPTVVDWSVSAATDDARVGLGITGARFLIDTPPGSTPEDVRDLLLAEIQDHTWPAAVSITPQGTDTIRLSATGPGHLWHPTAIGSGVAVDVVTSAPAQIETSPAELEIEIQSYATGRGLDAHAVIADMVGGLSSQDLTDLRADLGVSLVGPIGDVVDLTALDGSEWESRAATRIRARVRSYRAVPNTRIIYLAGSITTPDGTEPFEVNAP